MSCQVISTELEAVTQKSLLEQEEKDLNSEVDMYEDKHQEINRSKSETIDRIDR